MKKRNRNKFYIANVDDFKDSQGWFLGRFMDKYGHEILSTDEVEVCWKVLDEKFEDPLHFHKAAVEVAIVTKGWFVSEVDGKVVRVGEKDFFLVYPETKVKLLDFKKGTEMIVIKAPSVANDKYYK